MGNRIREPISSRVRFEVFKRDGFTCQYCGRAAPDVVLECDHIEPVKLGGSDRTDNLATSCADCNSGKSCTPLEENGYLIQRLIALKFTPRGFAKLLGVEVGVVLRWIRRKEDIPQVVMVCLELLWLVDRPTAMSDSAREFWLQQIVVKGRDGD